jgi:hypothetical protein
MAATIPFDEIVPGASARLAVIDGVQYLSSRDTLMHICGLTSIRANEKWRLLSEEVKNELAEFLGNFQFPGKGNRLEPVLTFQGILKLIMMVSGEKAALYRSAMVKILSRYYAGEGSLMEEINANAQSTAPIAQLARESLQMPINQMRMQVQQPAVDELSLTRKRRMEELEIERLEVELESRKVELEAKRFANVAMARVHLIELTGQYRELCQDTVMDERARLMLKDSMLNMAMNQHQGPAGSGQRLLTNGVSPNKPISLSSVALELGLEIPENDFIPIGREVSKRYLQLHGKKPPKHDQLIRGKVTLVNSYFERDRPLVEEVLRWHAGGRV